jgi:hypothetical protein
VIRQAAACAALALGSGAAPAAGGHHAVDDAVLLPPGQCNVETWLARDADGQRLLHAGPGCRVGPVELAAAAERTAGPAGTLGALQVRAAQPLGAGWSLGASLTLSWTTPSAQRTTSAVLLATWAQGPWALHANVGRDLVHGAPDLRRRGAAVEWSANERWQLLAERYDERSAGWLRGGVRWSPQPDWSLDISRAARVHGAGAPLWTVGASWQFAAR